MFDAAQAEKKPGQSDLVPFWCFGDEQAVKIERIVPMYPMSRDEVSYERLIKIYPCTASRWDRPGRKNYWNIFLGNARSLKS